MSKPTSPVAGATACEPSSPDIPLRTPIEAEDERRLLASLIATLPDLFWVKDLDGRYIACNKAFERFVGMPAAAVIGCRDEAFVDSEMATHFRVLDRQTIDRGQPLQSEDWIDLPSLGRRAMATLKSPVYASDGALIGILGIARDITARRSNELVIALGADLARAASEKQPFAALLARMLDGVLALPSFSAGCVCEVGADGTLHWLAESTADGAADDAALIAPAALLTLAADPTLASAIADALAKGDSVCLCAGGSQPAQPLPAAGASTCDAPAASEHRLLLPLVFGGRTRAALLLECRSGQCLPTAMPALLDNLRALLADAGERWLAIDRLRQQRKNSEELFAALPDLVFVTRLDGSILHYNAAVTATLAADESGLLGQSLLSIYTPALRGEVQRLLAAASAGESRLSALALLAADGSQIDVEARFVRSQWNDQPALIGIMRNTAERSQAAAALRHSEQRFRQVFAIAPMATALTRLADGRFLEVNDAYAQIFGWPRERMLTTTSVEIGIWANADERADFIATLRANGGIHGRDVTIGDAHGGMREVILSATLADIGGESCLLSMLHDQTDRQRAQAEVLAARELVRDVTDALPVAVFRYTFDDGNYRVLFCNRTLLDWCGVTADEALADPQRVLSRVHDEDLPAFREAQWHAWEQRLPLNRDVRLHAVDGVQRWLHVNATPMTLADGRCVYNGYAQDISASRRANDALRLAAGVFEHAHEGVVICDADASILDVNRSFTQLSGYARSDVIGRSVFALQGSDLPADALDVLRRSIAIRGYWRGELWSRRRNGERYAQRVTVSSVFDDDNAVSHYIAIFSDITQAKQQQIQLERMAHYDALTQLPNRVLLADRLQQGLAHARRYGRMLGLAYLDLDGFKPINDRFGHEAGDRLLVEVARRLRSGVRGDDTVARLGGDEFVLLLSEVESADECCNSLQRLLAIIAAPYRIGDEEFAVTASIGVTLFPQDDADADTLLRHADQAMYLAKQAGRSRFHLYDSEQDRRARAQHEASARIHEALRDGEFILHYQPKVDMRRGRIYGVEALIRWQHPERGLLLPGEFLPVIENSEFAISLGAWVLGETLRQLTLWQAAGLELSASINVSARELADAGFIARLRAALHAHPAIAPQQLELEVLESAALGDVDQATRVIEGCHALGVKIALDDFGTGYSSLTYFRRLPVDTLKIDRSFVRDMLCDAEDLAIVEGVIALTRAFRRKVVAEGVETPEHGLALLHLGCDCAQGYGIARPMPAVEIADWISRYRPDPAWTRADLTLGSLFAAGSSALMEK